MKVLRAYLGLAFFVILASAIAAGAESPKDLARETRINTYFREANENVGALECDVRIYKRDVPDILRRAIKARDHFKCVICGSTVKLEVDHKRALENGGNNSPANLATLCDDCHTIKTRYDHSLRRKREKLCGKTPKVSGLLDVELHPPLAGRAVERPGNKILRIELHDLVAPGAVGLIFFAER